MKLDNVHRDLQDHLLYPCDPEMVIHFACSVTTIFLISVQKIVSSESLQDFCSGYYNQLQVHTLFGKIRSLPAVSNNISPVICISFPYSLHFWEISNLSSPIMVHFCIGSVQLTTSNKGFNTALEIFRFQAYFIHFSFPFSSHSSTFNDLVVFLFLKATGNMNKWVHSHTKQEKKSLVICWEFIHSFPESMTPH